MRFAIAFVLLAAGCGSPKRAPMAPASAVEPETERKPAEPPADPSMGVEPAADEAEEDGAAPPPAAPMPASTPPPIEEKAQRRAPAKDSKPTKKNADPCEGGE